MKCGRVHFPPRGGLGDWHHDGALGHKCKRKYDVEAPCCQVEEVLTNEEIMDHVQHMECEKNDVELIESDDVDVDTEPLKDDCRGMWAVFAKRCKPYHPRCLSWGRKYITSPTTSKQVTGNASNMCNEPQAKGNRKGLPDSGYLRSC